MADHVRVDHEERGAEDEQPEPGPADRQDREAEEADHERDRAERAGKTTPGWKISNADPRDPGEEEQRDQVRVDQRVRGGA